MLRLLAHIPRPEARAVVISLLVSAALLLVKFIAYLLTGSTAIFSDAMESIVNVAAAAVAMYSLSLAHRPPDPDHPYGHGKVEFLSAGFEGGMILLAGVVIVGKATLQLFGSEVRLQELATGILLMAAAMLVNGAVGVYLILTGRRHHSLALEADGYHLISDAVTSVVALVALGVVKWTGRWYADPIGALVIAAYIGYMGLGLLRRAMAGLMDKQDLQDQRTLREILDAHLGPTGKTPRICSYHKLRHRHSGRYHWVDFHIMVPPSLTVEQGHAIASSIEYEIEQALGPGNATAHVEPCHGSPCLLTPEQADSRGGA